MKGFCENHNYLIKKSNGKILLVLNPDMRLESDFLSRAIEGFDNYDVAMVAPCLFRIYDITEKQNSVIDSAGMHMRCDFRHLDILSNRKANRNDSKKNRYVFGSTGAALFIKREILNKIKLSNENYFDEDFFMGREDADLSLRIQSIGQKCLFIPGCIGYHIRTTVPENRKDQSRLYNYHQLKNRYLLMINNISLPIFIIILLPICIREVIILVFVLLCERTSINSYSWIYSNLGNLFKKRKYIRSNRTQNLKDELFWYFNKYKDL